MPNPFVSKKVIFHIDYDSFFASVEQQYHPELRHKPVAVTGSSLSRGIVTAASREAKKYGVKTAMPLFKARKICPQIIPVKGDFEKYKYINKKSLEIFSKYSDLVEPFSIDEAFLDMTKTIKFFGTPEQAIQKLKIDLQKEFGPYITCSVGVGPNKLLAKLVSDFNKPNGFFIVNPNNLEYVLKTTPLEDFCGIGRQISKRLSKMGVHTVLQLQKTNKEVLRREFGNVSSEFLYNLSHGIGSVKVKHCEHRATPKSIGHEHTLAKNTKDIKVLKSNLQRLSEMVGKRLRKHEMLGKTISIHLRDSDFKGYHQRETIGHYTESSYEIFKAVERMMDRLDWKRETRLVGVTIGNLIHKSDTPLPLFIEDQEEETQYKVMDHINGKFGSFTIIPANTLLADETKSKISSFVRH